MSSYSISEHQAWLSSPLVQRRPFSSRTFTDFLLWKISRAPPSIAWKLAPKTQYGEPEEKDCGHSNDWLEMPTTQNDFCPVQQGLGVNIP